jgi:hypothetical protein
MGTRFDSKAFQDSRLIKISNIQIDSLLANTLWEKPHKHSRFQAIPIQNWF